MRHVDDWRVFADWWVSEHRALPASLPQGSTFTWVANVISCAPLLHGIECEANLLDQGNGYFEVTGRTYSLEPGIYIVKLKLYGGLGPETRDDFGPETRAGKIMKATWIAQASTFKDMVNSRRKHFTRRVMKGFIEMIDFNADVD